ncbi:Uncharacterised protein [Sphingobacterium spiritivorum]|uniref:Uncharacterized protein n=1 Tax=Sphingobacterium spiritivorum TaxID=258 RepID=A0A380BRG9_SPHSI|nr:hypothetical protein [Sphingobacterium spiritivorum]SUJ04707.1 Uncharacterised protein [Sphingobacterium spiritivorum]
MKPILLILFLLSLSNSEGQNKKTMSSIKVIKKNTINNSVKNDTIKYFNIDKYKDWELDNSYTTSTDKRKFLKKRNERIEINFLSDGIQVRLRKFDSPYEKIEGYSNSTKLLIVEGFDFYGSPINKTIQYDEKHQIIKEIDYEKTYRFTIKDLIQKIRKEYHVDLENVSQGGSVKRNGKDGTFYYEVSLKSKEEPLKMDYILVDGNTGKTLFKSYYYMKGGEKNPFDEYLKTLRNK